MKRQNETRPRPRMAARPLWSALGFLIVQAAVWALVEVGALEGWWWQVAPLAVSLLFGFLIGRWWAIPLGIVPALMQAAIYVNDPVSSRGEMPFDLLVLIIAVPHFGVMAAGTWPTWQFTHGCLLN